jgi:hypothetical protein
VGKDATIRKIDLQRETAEKARQPETKEQYEKYHVRQDRDGQLGLCSVGVAVVCTVAKSQGGDDM